MFFFLNLLNQLRLTIRKGNGRFDLQETCWHEDLIMIFTCTSGLNDLDRYLYVVDGDGVNPASPHPSNVNEMSLRNVRGPQKNLRTSVSIHDPSKVLSCPPNRDGSRPQKHSAVTSGCVLDLNKRRKLPWM